MHTQGERKKIQLIQMVTDNKYPENKFSEIKRIARTNHKKKKIWKLPEKHGPFSQGQRRASPGRNSPC